MDCSSDDLPQATELRMALLVTYGLFGATFIEFQLLDVRQITAQACLGLAQCINCDPRPFDSNGAPRPPLPVIIPLVQTLTTLDKPTATSSMKQAAY